MINSTLPNKLYNISLLKVKLVQFKWCKIFGKSAELSEW